MDISLSLQERAEKMGVQIAPDGTVTKGDFAILQQVSKSALSHWIKSGKITSDSLTGTGRTARVRLMPACQQLRNNTDPAQRTRLGSAPRLDLADDPGVMSPSSHDGGIAATASDYEVQRARKAKIDADLGEARLRQMEGKYLLAEDVEVQTRRMVMKLTQLLDNAPLKLGKILAAELGMDIRTATISARDAMREIRKGFTSTLKAMGETEGEA